MAKKKKKKKSNVVLNIFIALVFLAGAGVFLYPTISDMWNQYRNAQLVSKYEEAVTELSDNDYDRLWKEAKEYNAEHPVNAIVDAFEEEDTYELSHPYDGVLDPNGDGLMGSIEIPKIKAKLAIYHGLSKTVLEKGVGHVEGTSLPIGGKGLVSVGQKTTISFSFLSDQGGRYEKSLQNCEKQKIGTFNIVRVQRKSTENLRYKDIKSRNIRELSVSDSQSIFGFL